MGLKTDIITLFDNELREIHIGELYKRFPNIAQTTVRGRLYDAMSDGIVRIGTGLYISAKAIIEQGDSLKIIERMVQEGDKFDTVFLDIPYISGGQKGGNRDLSTFNTISPTEFGQLMKGIEQLLRTDTSPVIYMFTSGKTSKRAHDLYLNQIPLKQHPVIGSYQKMWSTGNPMNMGKYIMPKENIYIFSRSGEIDFELLYKELEFALVPNLSEYPTAKPYRMIEKIIKVLSNAGDWVLDPFGGSGQTLKACLTLGRNCHIIDCSDESINKHLLPKLIKV